MTDTCSSFPGLNKSSRKSEAGLIVLEIQVDYHVVGYGFVRYGRNRRIVQFMVLCNLRFVLSETYSEILVKPEIFMKFRCLIRTMIIRKKVNYLLFRNESDSTFYRK